MRRAAVGGPGGRGSARQPKLAGAARGSVPAAPGTWAFGNQLWKGDEPCTAEACEAGYTSGDLAVSVERSKTVLRVVAGFRGCENTAWNEYEVGKRASKSDTRTIRKRLKETVGTSAKYCKVAAPPIADLDARYLYR